MYTEPERRISLNRLLLFAVAQGVGFALVRIPNLVLPGDGDFAVQVFAPLSLAAVVLIAATPRLSLFFSAIVVAGACFAYVAAFVLGVNIYRQVRHVPDVLGWGIPSFVGAIIFAFVVLGMFFERADARMTLLVGIVPVASVILLPLDHIGRVWWTLYHGVWCCLFLGSFAIACKLRGRLEISGWKDPRRAEAFDARR